MTEVFRAAAVQICAGPNKEKNWGTVEHLVRTAASGGASLVVLPEVFFWRGARTEEAAAAEPIPGPTTDRLAALARDLRIHIVGGSILERCADEKRMFNTSTLHGPDGSLLARYRKIHLFDVDIPGHVSVRESDTRQPGSEPVVVRTERAIIGLTICYDLRFPELYRNLVLQGAQVICVPSAFTFFTGAAHWEVLLRARAIENQVFVIAPNQIGESPAGVRDFGNSMIVDPWGIPIARASNVESTVISAEIDLGHLARVRRELPCLQHRRLMP